MRRYTLEINGKQFSIEVEELASDRFQVVVGDETFEVQLAGDEDLPGATISPLITPGRPAGPMAHPDGAPVPRAAALEAAPAGPLAPRASATPRGPRGLVLSAPMPGVILEIHVAPGAAVRRGQPVAVLEAMKMRNTLGAPHDGIVAEVLVQSGQAVGHGEELLRFEASGR